MVGFVVSVFPGRRHLYLCSCSQQVMRQYFFALTLPIQLSPATIIHSAEHHRTLYR
jgi:hypothetical protein